MEETHACGFTQQIGIPLEALVDFDLCLAMVALVELKHWCCAILRTDERSSDKERVGQSQETVTVELSSSGRAAVWTRGVRLQPKRVRIKTEAVVLNTL